MDGIDVKQIPASPFSLSFVISLYWSGGELGLFSLSLIFFLVIALSGFFCLLCVASCQFHRVYTELPRSWGWVRVGMAQSVILNTLVERKPWFVAPQTLLSAEVPASSQRSHTFFAARSVCSTQFHHNLRKDRFAKKRTERL